MKISIGMNLQSGPWGGGNQFGHALVKYLQEQGDEVYFDLKEPDLDLILLTEPRRTLQISAYTDKSITKYLVRKNWRTIVVHRINDCDERKQTIGVNQRLIRANFCADHTVFISTWLKDLFIRQGLKTLEYGVILNGADSQIFNSEGYHRWNGSSSLKLVTHHWGAGRLKGFDIYEELDRLLAEPEFRNKIKFTYIGNLPSGFSFANVQYYPPASGIELAQLIRNNHIYLTASQYEPAGMHHIEGAMCGLPLLYRKSGALPEYCNNFGIGFTTENFVEKFCEMMDTYYYWVEQIQSYPYTAERMCQNYYQLFQQLIGQRDNIIKRRQWWPNINRLAHLILAR